MINKLIFCLLLFPIEAACQIFSSSKVEPVMELVKILDEIIPDLGDIDTVIFSSIDTTVWAHYNSTKRKAICQIKSGDNILYSMTRIKNSMRVTYGGFEYRALIYSDERTLKSISIRNRKMNTYIKFTPDKALQYLRINSPDGNKASHLMKLGYDDIYESVNKLLPLSILYET